MTAPAGTLRLAERGRPAWRRRLWSAGAAAGVLLFWWGVTGALLALQRDAHTRVLALALAVASVAAGAWCTRRARRLEGVTSGAQAVLGGALLWTAVSAAFYGGWLVGPRSAAALGRAGDAPTLARAAGAVAATWHSTALSLALLGLALVAARRGARGGPAAADGSAAAFAPGAFLVLWAAHELAKLNVFFGVANAGADLLPAYLSHLRVFFGPARNSALLGPSVALLAAGAVGAAAAALRAGAARRAGFLLVAGVLLLAAFEHALLGADARVGWWDAFLRWRGTA